jgi:hypothetical protein
MFGSLLSRLFISKLETIILVMAESPQVVTRPVSGAFADPTISADIGLE